MKHAILWGVALLLLAQPALAAGDARSGERIAKRWCAGCHLVDGARGVAADVAPPFRSIARDPAKTADYIRTFLAHPRHPMPDFSLTREEIDDVTAYIRGLAESRPKEGE